MTARAVAVAMGLCLALPGLAVAQGLGDAASQEAQKRAKAPAKKEQPVRTLTNEDLERARPAGEKGKTEAELPETGAASEAPSSPGVDRDEQLRPYVSAVESAQSRVQGLEAQVQELGAKLNPMSPSFIYGTSSGTAGNLQGEEQRVRQALTQAEAQLVEARKALAQANESLDDARRGRFAPRQP
jgi:hypothetical protein